jgi:competence ComEA-like helix-hairpin-helix protein
MRKPIIDLKQLAAGYFSFSKQERRALLVIFSGILLLAIAPAAYRYFAEPHLQTAHPVSVTAVKELSVLDSNTGRFDDRADFGSYSAPEKRYRNFEASGAASERFFFDPNTATVETWQRLGVSPKTAQTIQKYISKGGRFRTPNDLGKIYSLPKPLAEELIPYVQIAAAGSPNAGERGTNASFTPPAAAREKTKLPPANIADINTADTAAWIALPGIGSKLANRIVNYRDKLGGFYSISQIAETYGLADSTFQQIKDRLRLDQNSPLRTININTADAKTLKHPYLTWSQANAIVAYRNQHGPFANTDELKKIMMLDQVTLDRYKPYLTIK